MSIAKELLDKMEGATSIEVNDRVVATVGRFDTISGRVTKVKGRTITVLTKDNKEYRLDPYQVKKVPFKLKVGDKVVELEWSGQFSKGQELYVVSINDEGLVGVNPDKDAKSDDPNTLYDEPEEFDKLD